MQQEKKNATKKRAWIYANLRCTEAVDAMHGGVELSERREVKI